MNKVKDMTLAEQGRKQIEWAEMQMSGLMKIKERFEKEKPLQDQRIGMALHVTKETGALVRTLRAGGAEVAIASCNPLSTQDDVAAALADEGVQVFAKKGETNEEYYEYINHVLDTKPTITIDDGMDLVTIIHTKRPDLLENIIGGAEETTTGIIRLKAMHADKALKYPIIAVNDCRTKHLVDNYYGTGQSTLDGILRATNVLIAGKTFVVCGYGDCGKGVAMRAKGLGANVIVTEVSAFRALQAHLDGHRVMPIVEAAKIGDVFLTVTGDKHAIDIQHLRAMKDGAIIANSGHFNAEINLEALGKEASSSRDIRQFMKEYVLNGKRLFVLGEGRLVNLAAAEGHPSTVMNFSFCDQSLAAEYIAKHPDMKPGVYHLPEELDDEVARLQLDAWGVKFDELTPEQEKYLKSWDEGT
ncbi:MAG: adenosylhomocysteinase [Candidatus Diapherotrites archaeon]|nr:adenosylhomocysteinase [Candidatus Diapherotrites archaeon]